MIVNESYSSEEATAVELLSYHQHNNTLLGFDGGC